MAVAAAAIICLHPQSHPVHEHESTQAQPQELPVHIYLKARLTYACSCASLASSHLPHIAICMEQVSSRDLDIRAYPNPAEVTVCRADGWWTDTASSPQPRCFRSNNEFRTAAISRKRNKRVQMLTDTAGVTLPCKKFVNRQAVHIVIDCIHPVLVQSGAAAETVKRLR